MPKGLPWFRLYSEFAFDPKIQSMNETLQRRYVMFLCLRCNGDIPGLTDEMAACALRISPDELTETKEKFVSIGLISENYDINKWSERQYSSDSSTERVHKFRNKNGETLQKRYRNGNVTPLSVSVSESNSVSISKKKNKEKKESLPDFELFWKAYPRHIAKPIARKAFLKINPDRELLNRILSAVEFQKNGWSDPKYIPHPSTWLNQERWTDDQVEYRKSSKGIPATIILDAKWELDHRYDGYIEVRNDGRAKVEEMVALYKANDNKLSTENRDQLKTWEIELEESK